ncbi:hypothetical protein BFL36_10660 [Clavibacter michiganensis]|jgi:hypothetical protein|uniref:Uncharacterized protein n=2 Tax=Clavibacter TaxID=1573 RepID=A0A251YC32_9MICO|nr:hypothetical protein [Clavibacter michiganensis]MBT1636496.1 hypothetical protein [Clavibacter michiganensis]OQJ63938.1 hypothetical protein B5P24_13505 [Clavibacter michiganensis subsp. tessellarius]OUE21814.1 hypothetical protein BFL36_10660 [Clavibacter michiganensis]UKF33085.1 hypothetical protein FGG90_03210 [Clavibacter michiganensis subsp. tessellarius]
MTDSAPTDVRYLAVFADGPLEGTTETRVLVDGAHDETISTLSAVEGKESLFQYRAGEVTEVAGEKRVTYSFVADGSDDVLGEGDDESLEL